MTLKYLLRSVAQGRWLHLFRLVEKQYQDQILAQQEQYQCQIQVRFHEMGHFLPFAVGENVIFNPIVLLQLIQDEIKAMVQLQNRQASNQPHAEFSPNLAAKTCPSRKDCVSPLFPSDGTGLKNPAGENVLTSPARAVFSARAQAPQGWEPANQMEERATTGLSSGYGTLLARETSADVAGSPRDDEGGNQQREKQNWLGDVQQSRETGEGGTSERTVRVEEANPLAYQQGSSG